ncbi:hypothetical protein ACJX0J_033235, partial [Zea mays]
PGFSIYCMLKFFLNISFAIFMLPYQFTRFLPFQLPHQFTRNLMLLVKLVSIPISSPARHADAILGLDDVRVVQPFSPTNDIHPTSIYLSQFAIDSQDCMLLVLVECLARVIHGEEWHRILWLALVGDLMNSLRSNQSICIKTWNCLLCKIYSKEIVENYVSSFLMNNDYFSHILGSKVLNSVASYFLYLPHSMHVFDMNKVFFALVQFYCLRNKSDVNFAIFIVNARDAHLHALNTCHVQHYNKWFISFV